MRSIYRTLQDKGIRLVFANTTDDLKAKILNDLKEYLGNDVFLGSIEDVLTAYRQSTAS